MINGLPVPCPYCRAPSYDLGIQPGSRRNSWRCVACQRYFTDPKQTKTRAEISDEKQKLIAKYAKQGRSASEIARAVEVTPQTVWRYVRKLPESVQAKVKRRGTKKPKEDGAWVLT